MVKVKVESWAKEPIEESNVFVIENDVPVVCKFTSEGSKDKEYEFTDKITGLKKITTAYFFDVDIPKLGKEKGIGREISFISKIVSSAITKFAPLTNKTLKILISEGIDVFDKRVKVVEIK